LKNAGISTDEISRATRKYITVNAVHGEKHREKETRGNLEYQW
jgi:hypothetical protein